MLVATNTTGQQQLGKTPTLSLNTTANCLSSACVKTNNTSTSSSNNNSLSPNNLVIMSSALDVSTPTTAANVSPTSNNSSNGNNHKSNNNNGGQKFEAPYGSNVTSPCNSDGNNSQSLDESNGNNKSKIKNPGGVNLAAMDSSSRGERDSLQISLIRQNSTSTNSCSVQFHESSPNNGDSSNGSSNASHINSENNNKTNDEDKLNSNQTAKNNTAIKEEERDKSNNSSAISSSSSGNAPTNATQTSLSNIKVGLSTAVVKDEKEMIKKEETSLSSPNMSPVGFGSIVGSQINECNDNSGSTPNKSNDSTSSSDKRTGLSVNACNNENDETHDSNNLNLISSCNALHTNTNPLNSKSSLDTFCSDGSTSSTIASNTPNTPCNIPLNTSFIINNHSNVNGPQQGGAGGGGGNVSNIASGGGSGINNCMEYMQQQNHIFVFSTQLANKGADAVLAGQFPTIIAYHCTQPATKSFFEDFILKNPMKMTKLQRQTSLNIMGGLSGTGGPGSGGQPSWLTGNCNPMGKITHKLALNKSETITSSTNSSGSGVLNENDMMCWDQARSAMDSPSGESTNTMKMLENVENSNTAGKSVCSNLSNDDSGSIPSLQGVKVPDENLTPQQRQHREEQLAKLKKMNQFLFPENGGNDYHSQGPGNNSMMAAKLQITPDGLGGSAGMPGNPVTLMGMQGPNIGNKLNASAAIRNISGNILNHTKTGNMSNPQLDNLSNLGEDIIMASDMIAGSSCGPNEINSLATGLKQSCIPNLNNTGGLAGNGSRGLMNSSGSNLNIMNNSGPMGMPPGGLINDPNNAMLANTSDVLAPFNTNHCPSTVQEAGPSGSGMMGSHKNMNTPLSHPADMNSGVGMQQMEWSKLHHHIYEERLKTNLSNANGMSSEIGSGGGPSACQQTLTRSNSTGVGGGGSGGGILHRTNSNTSANNRSNQGPPPPYHPTQRSASVPIATQSPNPSSPNNPTSNMSLPSPRASNAIGGGGLSSTTSPSMDATPASSTASTANTNSTTTTTAVGVSSGSNSSGSTTNKNTFSQQGSPIPASAAGNSNRNRSTVNNLNSNPTTPLSHVSPKDIDSKNINVAPTSDHKSVRQNSQRSRSPLLNDVPNNAMEPRFPSPGLNFNPNNASGPNPQNFKNQNSSLERQNLQQIPQQFCRRTDNMPLNPNSNRGSQTKMSSAFDPISSLAQMSQQLTGGGVGLNSGGVGNSPNTISGLMGGPGSMNDININGLMGGQMMGGPVDPSMDHCNQNPNNGGNLAMSGLGAGGGPVPGPFGPGNCNMMGGNPGPICQRLLNPKMCGPNMSSGFNSNQVGGIGMRDVPSGFSSMMSSHRMMNHRMSANFGNFNVSPNIQVKASTPNTIQYMPVRPQNNNTNNNMRVPPSLEFLQRYANPQMMGNTGGVPGGGQGASPSDMSAMNGPNDLNKMPNTNNNMGVVNPNTMNQMNFFGNCNQMSGMGGMGQPVGGGGGVSEQDEMQGGSGMMPNHDPMNIPGPHAPMLRGMRPMRQGSLQSSVGMNSGSRMQHPSMGNIPPPNGMGGNSFPSNDGESLDCNDPSNGNIFNNPASAGLYQQQKNNKPPPMGMAHGPSSLNPNNSNNASLSNNNIINDQNPSSNPIQNSVMMGPNSSMLGSNIPCSNAGGPGGPMTGSNMGYKPFVGPASNDLKYAQQYHSFQQQLYATSTRNQQPGGGQQPPITMSPSSNPNASFFVNK